MVGRMLYCADYLEPGRAFDQAQRAELAERLPDNPGGVLREVARSRLTHIIQSGWPVLEPTVRFWNSLVATGASSPSVQPW
jgi:HD superfamily phosphohydrolase YqeK